MSRRTASLIVPIVLLVLFSCALPASAQTEQITLTTYYPAPFGVYQEMAARRVKVGNNYMLNTTVVSNNMLVVEGNIGIGTSAPTRSLMIVSPAGQSAIQIQSFLPAGSETGINFMDMTAGRQVRLRLLSNGQTELHVDGNMALDLLGGVNPTYYLVQGPVTGQYCIKFRYTNTSGWLYPCPAGFTAANGNNVAANNISGDLYCCRP